MLTLVKVSIPQWDIASVVKCSHSRVQYVLATYLFETFQGRNPYHDYQGKTTERKDRYIKHALKQNNSILWCNITNIV